MKKILITVFSVLLISMTLSVFTFGENNRLDPSNAIVREWPYPESLINSGACSLDEFCEINNASINGTATMQSANVLSQLKTKHFTVLRDSKLGTNLFNDPIIQIISNELNTEERLIVNNNETTFIGRIEENAEKFKIEFLENIDDILTTQLSSSNRMDIVSNGPLGIYSNGKTTFSANGFTDNYFQIALSEDNVGLRTNDSILFEGPPSTGDLGLSFHDDGVTLTTSENLYIKSPAEDGGQLILSGDTQPDSVASLVLISPNGSKWKLVVNDSGELSTIPAE